MTLDICLLTADVSGSEKTYEVPMSVLVFASDSVTFNR